MISTYIQADNKQTVHQDWTASTILFYKPTKQARKDEKSFRPHNISWHVVFIQLWNEAIIRTHSRVSDRENQSQRQVSHANAAHSDIQIGKEKNIHMIPGKYPQILQPAYQQKINRASQVLTHATTETKYQMQSRFLLNIVIR